MTLNFGVHVLALGGALFRWNGLLGATQGCNLSSPQLYRANGDARQYERIGASHADLPKSPFQVPGPLFPSNLDVSLHVCGMAGAVGAVALCGGRLERPDCGSAIWELVKRSLSEAGVCARERSGKESDQRVVCFCRNDLRLFGRMLVRLLCPPQHPKQTKNKNADPQLRPLPANDVCQAHSETIVAAITFASRQAAAAIVPLNATIRLVPALNESSHEST